MLRLPEESEQIILSHFSGILSRAPMKKNEKIGKRMKKEGKGK
jgi:hypothetical protein